MSQELVARYFAEIAHLVRCVPIDGVDSVVQHIVRAQARQASVFIFGNGGSAATASHFACDLSKGTGSHTGRRVRALSLTDSASVLTAWANDAGYETVFAEQLGVHARPGDLAIAISGSGNSPNVLSGIERARVLGLTTIGLTGFAGGRLAPLVDTAIVVPGSCIQAVEDVHSALCHAISLAVARALDEAERTSNRILRPAVFCDRDGVLNMRRSDHVKSWSEFTFVTGALEALARLSLLQLPVVLVTNQSPIGRGLVPAQTVQDIHRAMQGQIRASGGPEISVYMCPHAAEDSCTCRKPRPGLLYKAAEDLGLDLARSVFIGDSVSDMLAGSSAGCRCILIGDSGSVAAGDLPATIACVASLADAVELLLSDPVFTLAADRREDRILSADRIFPAPDSSGPIGRNGWAASHRPASMRQ
jgi:D-sedoheptulose 7-phosphate isomerase